jgi:hypothetical protein
LVLLVLAGAANDQVAPDIDSLECKSWTARRRLEQRRRDQNVIELLMN